MDKLKFKLLDDVDAVVGVISRWTPDACANEKAYERSLYAYLHEVFDDMQITKQFAQGRIRADLMVGNKVIIELKHNLNTMAKLHGLIGQLTQYDDWHGRIVVLLTGETEPNLRKQLKQFIQKQGWEDDDWQYGKVTIAEK